MNLYPLLDCAEAADKLITDGATVYQQFECAQCGAKQTMEEADVFYTEGKCEECGTVTDIAATGCNYLVVKRVRGLG